ncbi:MAG: protein kinase domain-containing protein [Ktedonobacterales bacterium]
MDTLAQCSRCGRDLPTGARFCPTCGAEVREGRQRLATGLLPTQKKLQNRYIIVDRLAQGGQSAVYLVTDAYDGGKQRAVKEMSESNLTAEEREHALNDFMREANMLRTLNHPALAKVYDTFVEGQKQFLVMEYVRGHNLEDELIQVGRPLEWDRVVGWGVALCDVLQYLHSQNPAIIYRDLKPANVMLTPEGAIKLIDFGIARWLHPMRARDTSQLGTDGYAPLEQYSARSETRSDLYALGASLYHLLTGRVPEAAPTRIAGQSLTPIRTINPLVPEAVEQVVHRALNLQARDRFDNAPQMREALQWARHQQSIPSDRLRTPSTASGPSGGLVGMTPFAASTPSGAAIGRSVTETMPPRLHIAPLRLDAGFLEMNDTSAMWLEVSNRGSGQLAGTTETNMPCLTVDPPRLNAGVTRLQVRINTAGLRPGPYQCHLAVRTNGGDQIVPVRFIVRPPIGA